MYYRRKILLSLLQIFGGKLPKIDFQKYLFLYNVNKAEPFFGFIPYKYGCFSFQANQDMVTLTKYTLVEESETHWLLKDKTNHLNTLKTGDKILLTSIYQKYKHLAGNELVKFVYEQYPYFAINSLKARKILDEEYYRTVVNSKPRKNEYVLFTIGYEGKTIEHFTNELIKNDIRVLCDIRKNALSMKYGFSKKQLRFIVENVGIKYSHIPELGIDSNKRQQLNSKKDYEKLFDDYEKNILPNKSEELEEVWKIFISNKRIALMCFEADHTYCHRSRTINSLTNLHKNECLIKHL
jgi:uncharacterized protein (DUF488 family)